MVRIDRRREDDMRKTMMMATGVIAALLAGCSSGTTDQAANTDTAVVTPDAPAAEAAPVAYASLTGDAAKGETLYAQCRACHMLEAGKNGVGPSLHGIIGRPAGQVPGYVYTPANKNSGLTWDEETLFAYLADPRKIVPGTKMAYAGMKDAQSRADVIAYLKTASK
jgi:cytochrome c